MVITIVLFPPFTSNDTVRQPSTGGMSSLQEGPEGVFNGNWDLPDFKTGKMGFELLGLRVKLRKMGIGNTSAIIRTVIIGHFLSSIAKTKVWKEKKSKKKPENCTALSRK